MFEETKMSWRRQRCVGGDKDVFDQVYPLFVLDQTYPLFVLDQTYPLFVLDKLRYEVQRDERGSEVDER